MRRLVTVLAIAAVLLSLLMLAVYAAFPQLAGWLAAREAGRLGLAELAVRAERPDLQGLEIGELDARSPAFNVQLREVRLRWSWQSLRQGRLLSVRVATASVVVQQGSRLPESAAEDGDGTQTVPGAVKAAVAGVFERLPFD
ncbi:MAG: hypothetical protein PVF57_18615, partial [Pseudomonadales bacterium]